MPARLGDEPPAAASTDRRPIIVAFGDSLSAGYGEDLDKSYPVFLQEKLNEAGYQYRVVNAGISGDTTSGGLARLDPVLALRPRVMILELGGNDGLRGLPVSTTQANLERMIEESREAGAKVLLAGITLPPNYGKDYIREFEAMYKDLAARYKVALIPFLLEGVAQKPALMQSDGIHPVAAGNKIVAATVFRYLEPLLDKRSGSTSE